MLPAHRAQVMLAGFGMPYSAAMRAVFSAVCR
jgi:hypothetical protein